MPTPPPATVAEFKAHFNRGFNYSAGPDGVMDSDIAKGIAMAVTVFNPALFSSVEQQKPVFLLAAAHFVVVAIQAAGGLYPQQPGTPGGGPSATKNTGSGVIGSKTVDDITLQYAGLDALIARYPTLAGFRQTDFGAQYALAVAPRLAGRVGIAANQGAPGIGAPAVPFLA